MIGPAYVLSSISTPHCPDLTWPDRDREASQAPRRQQPTPDAQPINQWDMLVPSDHTLQACWK